MESLPYNNIDELSQYLQLTFSGKTEDIQKATRIFTEMSNDIAQLFDSLIFIIVNDRTDRKGIFSLLSIK